jgi:carboxyl-terminal processing protease
MSPPPRGSARPLSRFILLAFVFAAGVLVERSGRLFTPYHYTPAGLEKTFAPFWETWDLIKHHYVNREVVQPERMTRGAIEGLLASLGDFGHTTYLTPDELKRLHESLEGRMEGIGARLSIRRRRPTVVSTVPGSPARAQGLKPGDVMFEVDSQQVLALPLDRIVSLVRGPAGTKVHIRIAREGAPKPLDFDIERARVEVPDVTWHLLPGEPVGHVAIQSFGEQAHTLLKTALEDLRKQGAKALIVDVRGNQGGLKEQAVAVTSEFVGQGAVFIEQDAEGHRTTVPVQPGGHALDIPLCLLIDEGSASSSEIFAGAIQDHGRGKLVGTRTFGTGTVLQPFALSDGSAVLLAVAEWLTPNGRQIWHHGISADVDVPLAEGSTILFPENEAELTSTALTGSEDKQLLKALELLRPRLH